MLSGQLWSASADRNPKSLNLNFRVILECIWSLYPKRHHSIPESKCQTRGLSTHLYPWNWLLSNFLLDALQIPSEWHHFYRITFLSNLSRAVVFFSLASSRYVFLLFFFSNSNHDNNVQEQHVSQKWQERTVNSNRYQRHPNYSYFKVPSFHYENCGNFYTSRTSQIVLGPNIAVYSLQAIPWSMLVFLSLPCFDFISAKIYAIMTPQRTVVSLYYCFFSIITFLCNLCSFCGIYSFHFYSL